MLIQSKTISTPQKNLFSGHEFTHDTETLLKLIESYRKGERKPLQSAKRNPHPFHWRERIFASLLLDKLNHTCGLDTLACMIQLMPKVELHYHLDGGISAERILQEAVCQEIDLHEISPRLPRPYSVQEIQNIISMLPEERFHPSRFEEWLTDKFLLPLTVMQTKEGLIGAAYDAIEDAFFDGLLHREIIFAPCLHTRNGLTYEEIMDAVITGLQKGKEVFGVTSSLRPSIYRNKIGELGFENHAQETVQAAVQARKKYKNEIKIGLDLVGYEVGFEPDSPLFKEAFEIALKNQIPLSLHAGELPGTGENIWKSVNLGARRIGHGIHASELSLQQVRNLVENQITFEVCPTSNVMMGNALTLATHPLPRMDCLGLAVTVNTDDAMVFGTTLSEEMGILTYEEIIPYPHLERLQNNALQAAWLPSSERPILEKRFHEYWDVIHQLEEIFS